jgi:GntR family transcriptional regulator, transcriptional repressor for pyruvate dehydrogenase complex
MNDLTPPNGSRRLVRAPKTAELIADQLRSQIVRGVLKQGDALPTEVELVKQFAVSRPTLREAFRVLESESLIVVRRGSRGGVLVSSPQTSVAARDFGLLLQMSGATLADVYEARRVLEPAAVRMLAERRTPDDIADLNAAAGALAVLVNEGPKARISASGPRRLSDSTT